MPSKPILALVAAPVALPMLVAVLFVGGGTLAPPASAAGTTCTVLVGPGPTGTAPTSASLSGSQVDMARVIVAGAKTLNLGDPVAQHAAAIGVMTAMQESSLTNLPGGDQDSIGLFQQRPSQGWGTPAQLADPGYQTAQFFAHLVAVSGWAGLPMWQAAQDVQRSADGALYAQWQPLGVAVAAALWDGTTGTLVCAPDPTSPGGTLPSPNGQAAAIAIAYAEAQLGKPYLWGGTGPDGYDCSGLVMMAYRQAGVSLPRTSEQQWTAGPQVPANQLQPGDLVFYNPGEQVAGLPGHVGIYLGNGLMIHAPHTGDVVRIAPVNDGDTYLGAIRPLPAP